MSNTSTTSSLKRKISGGYSELQTRIPFQVPYNIVQESKTLEPSLTTKIYYPDKGYEGVYKMVVNGIQDSEPNLKPENIVEGVEIFGVEGEATGTLKLQDNKIVNPELDAKEVTPNLGFDGLKKVTVNGIRNLDENLKPENIKDGVTIFGIEGTYGGGGSSSETSDLYVGTDSGIKSGDLFIRDTNLIPSNIKKNVSIFGVTGSFDGVELNLQEKTANPSTSQQTITYDSSSGYNGLSKVTVNAIQTETKSVTPSASQQTVSPSSGKYLTSVTVSGDSDLVADNIKKDVEIFGVTGTYEGASADIQPRTNVILTASTTRIDKLDGTDGMNYTTFTLDTSLRSVIKKGETILGITGTYEGGLGTEEIYNDGKFFQGFNGMSVHNLYYEAGSSSFSAGNGGPSSSAYSGTGYIYITPAINLSGYTRLCVDGGYSAITTPCPQYAVVSNPSSPSGNFVTIAYDSHFDIPSSMTTGYVYFKVENMNIHSSKSFWVNRIWLQ